MSPEEEKTSLPDLETRLASLETTPEQKKSKAPLFLGFFGLLLLAFGVFVFLNFSTLKDYLTGLSFEPTAEMAEIEEKLNLTSRADLIFKASFPVLETREDFNRDCNSHDSEISVLGCFTNDKIYIYNIDSAKLPGIIESTTAHELLHAIWSRLSGAEKATLTPVLEDVYSANKEDLEETLKNYEKDDRLDELYVRVGTQVKNLPADLETHYSKYFSNRAAIVDFYEAYIAPFNELKAELSRLESEMGTLKAEIDEKNAEYSSRAEKLNSDVKSFNICAGTEGCYTLYQDNLRRAELVEEEKNLNLLIDELNLKVENYNLMVEEYNNNVLKSNELQVLINSNASPTAINE